MNIGNPFAASSRDDASGTAIAPRAVADAADASALDYPAPKGRPCVECGEDVFGEPDECPHCVGRGPELAAGVTITVPLKLVPGMNTREHWRTRRRRVEREHATVVDALEATGAGPLNLPVTLVIIRTAWCELDPDNCAASAKGVIDSACSWLRVDDRDPGVHVHLAQRTTRARRTEHYGRSGRYQRVVVATAVTLTIRPWRPEDGTDRLRVLAAPPEAQP
jgi:hypothetical protein